MILIDPLEGSYFFSTISPLSNYIPPCPDCGGHKPNESNKPIKSKSSLILPCSSCQGTGKSLFPLNSADICFNGNGPISPSNPKGRISIGIEIKSASDLISSLSSKRLQGTQLPKMLVDYQLRFLLWYGRIRESKTRVDKNGNGAIEIWVDKVSNNNKPYGYWFDSKSNYSYSALQRFLCSPSFTNYFIEKHVESKEEAAKWIVELYEEWNKPWNSHKSMKVFDETKRFKHDDNDSNSDNDNDKLNEDQISNISNGRYGNHTSLGLSLSSIIPNKQYEQMVDLFGSIKGVGYDKARILANNYPTLISVKSITELANIEVPSQGGTRMMKIGMKLAERIFKIIYGNKIEESNQRKIGNYSKVHAKLGDKPDKTSSPMQPKKTLAKINLDS